MLCVGRQRGFSLIEILLVVTLMGALLVGALAVRGEREPNVHIAALAVQAALEETRALAMSNAAVGTSGATLTLAPLGTDTVLTVYKSRPIAGSAPPTEDQGFTARSYPVTIEMAGGPDAQQPFSIFISSSGYASVKTGYAYEPARPVMLPSDPGCDESRGMAITISDGYRTETHSLDCREAQYEASAPLPSPTAQSGKSG